MDKFIYMMHLNANHLENQLPMQYKDKYDY